MMETARSFNRVLRPEDADPDALQIMLFKNEAGVVCAWYLAPKRFGEDVAYVSEDDNLRAVLAVVRAIAYADRTMAKICIVDPDCLWDDAWTT